jgi:Xaa-Pro aminopeptidase
MLERITHLRRSLATKELPALLVTSAMNRRYLSGFSGSAGALLITPHHTLLFTDGRYTIQAADEAPDYDQRQIVNPGRLLTDLLKEAVAELELTTIGVEAAHMSIGEFEQLRRVLGDAVTLKPVDGLIEPLREVKDEQEIATLRKAIAITDAALEAVAPRLTPELSERQAAWLLETALREGGADAVSFPIIVAAGPNAARAHHQPGDTPLGSGRPIVIDMGARLNGYHADLTRTLVLGEPDAQFWTIYDTVLKAQRTALAGLRPGISGHAADMLARDVIIAAGYGEAFSHSLGHGVGLNIHEGPSLRRAPEGKEDASPQLQAGMVTSIEPGIYLAGWGGVRIEDLALITPEGCEVLSHAPKLR